MEFFRDLTKRLVEVGGRQSGKAPFEEDTCLYHEHPAAGKACYKELFR